MRADAKKISLEMNQRGDDSAPPPLANDHLRTLSSAASVTLSFKVLRRLYHHSGVGLDPHQMVRHLLDAGNILGGDPDGLALALTSERAGKRDHTVLDNHVHQAHRRPCLPLDLDQLA